MSPNKMNVQEIRAEVLVIGSEAAGAKAAIEAQEEGADVLIVTKGLMGRTSNTVMAGAGVQCPISDPRDSPDVHFEDTIRCGEYLNNQKLVERLINLSVTEVPKMGKWGAKFQERRPPPDSPYRVGLPRNELYGGLPGSTYQRGMAAKGFHGGLQWRAAFKKQVKRLKTKIMEDVFVTSLLLTDGQVSGAFAISLRTGQFLVFRAKVTILATGGCCQIYRMTDSSIDATGDGITMALNAGAELMGMEFQQFFPAACYNPEFFMSQITGGLRYGLHPIFYNSRGEAFMEKYLPVAKDWGLRDETSRAIYMENLQGRGSTHGGAYMSLKHLPANIIDNTLRHAPYRHKLERAGIDIHKDALECGPASHYTIGGIKVNENCETNLPRLYAVGEVATGCDGAERTDGGSAICWCFTMGYVGGKEAAKKIKELDWVDIDPEQVNQEQDRLNSLRDRKDGIRGFEVKNKTKDIMWKYCALIRDKKSLEEALGLIQRVQSDDLPRLACPGTSRVFSKGWVEALEATTLADLSEIVIRSALMREESRGAHYRSDFPNKDNTKWLKNIVVKRDRGKLVFTTTAPVMTRMRPTEEEVKE